MTADTPMRPASPKQACRAHTRGGAPCRQAPIRGGDLCRMHGGRNPVYARKAAVRAEMQDWGLNAPGVDPGETLLRLLAQSAARVARYGLLLAEAYAAAADQDGEPEVARAGAAVLARQLRGSGVAALIGWKFDLTRDGAAVPVAEAIRGLVELELKERELCARFAKLALDAGLDERRVRLAERQIDTLDAVLRAALDRAGLGAAERARVIDAVPVVLGEIVGGGAL